MWREGPPGGFIMEDDGSILSGLVAVSWDKEKREHIITLHNDLLPAAENLLSFLESLLLWRALEGDAEAQAKVQRQIGDLRTAIGKAKGEG